MVTNVGSATFSANLNPSAALELNTELMENLRQGVVLSSHLHLIYALIPPDVQAPSIDWDVFYNEVLFEFFRQLFCNVKNPRIQILPFLIGKIYSQSINLNGEGVEGF